MQRAVLPLAVTLLALVPAPLRAAGETLRAGSIDDLKSLIPSEWWRRPGRAFRFGEADKPAVLLFHGLNRDLRSWTAPGDDEGILRYTFREAARKLELGVKYYPGIGIYKIGIDKQQVEVNEHNWFDYLAAQGCTVAAFSQKLPAFADALETVEEVWPRFLSESVRVNPQSPPPIALIGHSRGGLVIRALIKRHPESMERVKWVITLHSPHQGSQLPQAPQVIEDELRKAVENLGPSDLDLPEEVPLPHVRATLAAELVEKLRPVLRFLLGQIDTVNPEDRELAVGSSLLAELARDEKKLPGASYHTFGGTDPNYARVYIWWFTAASAQPQTSLDLGVYYKWEAEPREIDAVSPLLAKVRDILPEITPGKGDGLVADARSRLPWSQHHTGSLNHAEPLWDRGIQRRVAGLILGRRLIGDLALRLPGRAAGEADGGARHEGRPRGGRDSRRGRGGGLDGIKIDTSDIKASEGDTATAIRGRPAPESREQLAATIVKLAGQLAAAEKRLAVLEERILGRGAQPERRGGGEQPQGTAALRETARAGGDATARQPGAREGQAPERPGAGLGLPAGQKLSVTPDPGLKGRLGRLVVTFPAAARVEDDVYLYTAGEKQKHSTWSRGGLKAELIAGEYAISVHKKRAEGLQVRAGHETNLVLGALRLELGEDTEWYLYEPGGKEYLTWGRGSRDLGALPGEYEVEINKRREKVAIRPGEITEF